MNAEADVLERADAVFAEAFARSRHQVKLQ